MAGRSGLMAVPAAESLVTWQAAAEAFLRRDIAPGTRRVYGLTLSAVASHLDTNVLAEVDATHLGRAVGLAYPAASPATWNRVVATVRSFLQFARRQGWVATDVAAGLERRHVAEDHNRALSREELDRLFSRRDVGVRDRALWRLLYETGARAEEVLRLNVEDLDLVAKRATTVRKGGDLDTIHFQTGSARLLPTVIGGRAAGPVFLSSRSPSPARAPASTDLCSTTGQARLSYRRAAEIFTTASGGRTLHQLRHSAITHLAEAGVPLPLLMAKSRHASLRTLQRYARPSVEAVAALTAAHDPAARRR
ncbi:MAG: site-specific integrase [Cellulomonas sp.]|uniref:tyrosine-type recombinase/integrase n=1 Tax=Cellulomonas sp. TaxID=40001 RepID=UPI0017E6F3F3|nr:site-specific integrase [Cellulomonas sp.]NMM29684.1 site-specific integrase [Cellulomonas sp.]